jgi:hypothetical protein
VFERVIAPYFNPIRIIVKLRNILEKMERRRRKNLRAARTEVRAARRKTK